MSEAVTRIMVKLVVLIMVLACVLGFICWWLQHDVPPFLAGVPASGFTLLAAMWQVGKNTDRSPVTMFDQNGGIDDKEHGKA